MSDLLRRILPRSAGHDEHPASDRDTARIALPAADVDPDAPPAPSFRDRGRLRRRLRYLRRARDLHLRDLGGFVYDMRRFGGGSDDLVEQKVAALVAADAELDSLEGALRDRRELHELREPGIGGTCASCGELFASEARFCSNCGKPVSDARDADDADDAGATPPR